MGNFIVLAIILVISSMSIYKIIHDKRNGVQCAGCPHSPKGVKKGESKPCASTQIISIDIKK